MYLLDVNVLVALLDPAHVFHERASRWFASIHPQTWATCPITENGVLRILTLPRYRNSPGGLAAVARYLLELQEIPGHVFWADEFSLISGNRVSITALPSPSQITDSYLLALAVAHEAKFVTFDRRISTGAVLGGPQALFILNE